MITRPASQLDSLALATWPRVDLVRAPGDLWWCVIVGRGRRREDGPHNHVRTACDRVVLVTRPGLEIAHNASEYRELGDRADVCLRCRPTGAGQQMELRL